MAVCTSQSALRSPKPAMPPRAFTLIEMLISLAILAIIAAAMGSTILLASKALDQDTGGGAATVAARRAADRVLAEVGSAVAFSERTDTAVAFTVPDRDGDGTPDTIRYAWSGVDGDPLTRQYNGGAAEVVAENVQHFDLAYFTRTVDPPPPKEVESPEQVLIAHDDAPSGTIREQAIQDKNACGAYFKPELPANTLRWKVTRVEVVVRRASLLSNGTVFFDLTSATSSGRPGTPVLATTSVAASGLPLLPQWKAVSFGGDAVASLSPGQGLCLVARTPSDTVQATFEYEEAGSPMTPNTHWLIYNRSAGWSGTQDVADMRIKVWGTVTTAAQ